MAQRPHPKCSLNCNRGCGRDHSSKAPQSPSLVDIEVVRKIFAQAIVNMCSRLVSVANGEMTIEEQRNKDLYLAQWLGETFCAYNKHFEPGPEGWNPSGLAEFVRQQFKDKHPENDFEADDETAVFSACAIFVGESYKALEDTLKNGVVLTNPNRLPDSVDRFVEAWTMLFVGAPQYG